MDLNPTTELTNLDELMCWCPNEGVFTHATGRTIGELPEIYFLPLLPHKYYKTNLRTRYPWGVPWS